jgi:hypothetical protein
MSQRFAIQDTDILKQLNCLGIPDKIIYINNRYTDMVSRFGRNPTEMCLIVFNAHHLRATFLIS